MTQNIITRSELAIIPLHEGAGLDLYTLDGTIDGTITIGKD